MEPLLLLCTIIRVRNINHSIQVERDEVRLYCSAQLIRVLSSLCRLL